MTSETHRLAAWRRWRQQNLNAAARILAGRQPTRQREGASLWWEHNLVANTNRGCMARNGDYSCELPDGHPGEHRRQLGTTLGPQRSWHVW